MRNGASYNSRYVLNLKDSRVITIPLTKIMRWLIIVGVILVMSISPIARAPGISSIEAAENEDVEESESPEELSSENMINQRRELENRLVELEEKIGKQKGLISGYQAQGRTLKNEMASLNARIEKLSFQIEAVDISLSRLNQDIYETQGQINRTQNKIKDHKDALAQSIRSLYETDNQNLIAILLQNSKLSDFFNNINNLLLIQDNIRLSLNDIIKLRQEFLEQKQELGLEKEDVENLKIIRQGQKGSLQGAQSRKANLLAATKNKESEYQKLLDETRKTAAEIRGQIFRLIGGGELSFEKAYELARLAEGATGIRAALILAILDRESLLGKNVGRCSYEKAMHPKRDIPVFLKILENLGIDSSSIVAKVSCPNAHGTYGGAMGPAQFIPSTWAIYGGYRKGNSGWEYKPSKDLIGSVAGEKPSNPWSNADAFVATALYIEDLYYSRTCEGYANGLDHLYPKQELQEECAAARYYAGGRWKNYYRWYGIPVVERADELQEDIDILNS